MVAFISPSYRRNHYYILWFMGRQWNWLDVIIQPLFYLEAPWHNPQPVAISIDLSPGIVTELNCKKLQESRSANFFSVFTIYSAEDHCVLTHKGKETFTVRNCNLHVLYWISGHSRMSQLGRKEPLQCSEMSTISPPTVIYASVDRNSFLWSEISPSPSRLLN